MILHGLSLPCVNSISVQEGHSVLSRFPDELNRKLGHTIGHNLYAQEIRLVPEEPVTITLACRTPFPENKCEIFYGEFGPAHEIAFDDRVTFTVEPFSLYGQSVQELSPDLCAGHFDPRVVRIVLLCKGVSLESVEGIFRLPAPEQLPAKKLLVYGTSLSQGTSSHLAMGAYPWLLGRRLGYDVYNYALAGCCLIEREMVEFLAGLPESFDLILFEPSTNLFAQGYPAEEFARRCRLFIDAMLARHNGAPIVCLDLFPSLFDYGFTGGFHPIESCGDYRAALKTVVSGYAGQPVYLVKTGELLDVRNLSADLMHPTSIGYFQIAERLLHELTERGIVGKETTYEIGHC